MFSPPITWTSDKFRKVLPNFLSPPSSLPLKIYLLLLGITGEPTVFFSALEYGVGGNLLNISVYLDHFPANIDMFVLHSCGYNSPGVMAHPKNVVGKLTNSWIYLLWVTDCTKYFLLYPPQNWIFNIYIKYIYYIKFLVYIIYIFKWGKQGPQKLFSECHGWLTGRTSEDCVLIWNISAWGLYAIHRVNICGIVPIGHQCE